MEDSEYTETYGTTTYTSSQKIKSTTGINAAIGYEFKLGKRLSLETGLKYQTRGYKMVSEWSQVDGSESYSNTSSYDYKMNYLDIPIVLNTAIITGDFKVYARTGIYAGLLTRAKLSEQAEWTSTNGDNGSYDESQTYSGGDIADMEDRITGGIILGVGAEYNGFYFEANYNLGAYSLANMDYELSTRDLSLSLGYKFKFNK